jgi:hypothetical protein
MEEPDLDSVKRQAASCRRLFYKAACTFIMVLLLRVFVSTTKPFALFGNKDKQPVSAMLTKHFTPGRSRFYAGIRNR